MRENLLHQNLERVRERIGAAARRAGRRPEEITLIAASKTHPAEAIRAAFGAGIRHFGENRVQEWEGKRPGLFELPARWHFIGHLQGNKAARAARLFHSIDSVHDLVLARKLDRARAEFNGEEKLRVLLEVGLAQEAAKSGVEAAELPRLAEAVAGLRHLTLAGLMCIPPYFDDAREARPYFRRLRELRDALSRKQGLILPVLSMGMSHDFEVAIEEGATEVRIGTALFGAREMK